LIWKELLVNFSLLKYLKYFFIISFH
jgi:hypothetical protein